MSSRNPGASQTATPSTNRRLAFAVFGAPLAWSISQVVNVALVGRNCGAGSELAMGVPALMLAVTVVAAVIAGAGALVGLSTFRAAGGRGPLRSEGFGRVEFVGQVGFILSTYLFINIVYFAFVPWVVSRCSPVA